MGIDIVQIVIFLLAFVPGFIFIQTIDHHLVKGEKSQFEKTIQILLASTIIWLISLFIPIFPIQNEKIKIINYIKNNLQDNIEVKVITKGLIIYFEDIIKIYIFLCLYTFIFANLWGIIRRNNRIDNTIRMITKRDWYKTVSLRFYDENINSTIAITKKDKSRYIGILNGAPDDNTDNYILLLDPYIIEKKNKKYFLTKLAAISMIINLNEIDLIEVIKKPKRRKIWQKKKSIPKK
jgi:hypothetical protein